MSQFKRFEVYFAASTILAGTILGAGIFSLPYIFSQSGSLIFLFYLALATIICTITHLIFGESLLRTKEEHRFIGLAEIYLGPWAKKLVTLTTFISVGGCLLAYLILGGQFIYNFFNIIGHPIDLNLAVLLLWFLGSLGVVLGIKFISIGEAMGAILILVLIFTFFIFGIPHLNLSQIPLINFKEFFLPYGVLLFALSGGSAVPEIFNYFRKKSLTPHEINFKKPIILGSIAPAFLYLIFVLGAIGILGAHNISWDVVPQLVAKNPILGMATDLLGLVLIITSYFILAFNFKNSLILDLKLQPKIAWLIPVVLPLLLYQLGIHNFIKVIGFLGAFILGIESLLNFLIHKKAQTKGNQTPPYLIKIPSALRIILIALLVFGAIFEIVNNF
ncbi:MAG: aromatic amino acid transport family protein [Minisyncoccia bacterium]